MNGIPPHLKNIIPTIPAQPGVYLFRDRGGVILYIGKASSLKTRVSSYFHSRPDPKTSLLADRIHGIEYIATDSEIEALLLESTLIKKHRPKYNIKLKDDKRYPYLAVTLDEEFPRVVFTRNTANSRHRYFGPYTDAKAARKIVQTINRIFKLKTCTRDIPLKEARPCLNYQMKRCRGVCMGKTNTEEYRSLIQGVLDFLNGRIEPIMENLNRMMSEHSRKMEYEKAAHMRDIIADIDRFSQSQKVFMPMGADQDYVALAIQDDEAVLVLFEFRGGALLGRKIYIFDNSTLSGPAEIARRFIIDHYTRPDAEGNGTDAGHGSHLPSRIVSQHAPADNKIIAQHLSLLAAKKISIGSPASKEDRAIIAMVSRNIAMLITERQSRKMHRDKERGLEELSRLLGLAKAPETIESFDISNIGGKNAVASMVRFTGGLPDRKRYRRYRIRVSESANDPGMIHEVVARRLQHLLNEEKDMPDLILIDGGAPQLARAVEAANALRIDIRIIALAKKNEEIYAAASSHPIRLNRDSPALKILQNIRDEAHRFASAYHTKSRDADSMRSLLDEIPDIGETRKKAIMRRMRSIEAIRSADRKSLESIPGIGRATARKVYEFFHKK